MKILDAAEFDEEFERTWLLFLLLLLLLLSAVRRES